MTAGETLANPKSRICREVMEMDKNTNKNANKNTNKAMNRTEFAQEYSIDTGKTEKTNKANKKTNQSK